MIHSRCLAAALAMAPGALPAPAVIAQPAASQPAASQSLAALDPPGKLAFIDRPNDAGEAVMLTWPKMAYEGPGVFYELWAATQPDGPFVKQNRWLSTACPTRADFPARFGVSHRNAEFRAVEIVALLTPAPILLDAKSNKGKPLTVYAKLRVVQNEQVRAETGVLSATPVSNWFARQKTNLLIATLLASGVILFFLQRARLHPDKVYIRRIGGLEAVDEALGRAAEMGKPAYFCHGLGAVDEVATIASLNLLGKMSERVAELGVEMKVTCRDYFVMQVSQEMVKEGCVRVGRPDMYREETIMFPAIEQFPYATAVEGMLLREKPATCFFFGSFAAEALLLSETGAVTKAIQIAGTDAWSQIPFFITTCDYTLIGEELFAASAYLAREPKMLGTVKGQDALKAVLMALVLLGTGCTMLAVAKDWQWLRDLVKLCSPLY